MDAEGCQAVYALLNEFASQERTLVLASADPYVTKAAHLVLDLGTKPVPRLIANPARAEGDDAATAQEAGAR